MESTGTKPKKVKRPKVNPEPWKLLWTKCECGRCPQEPIRRDAIQGPRWPAPHVGIVAMYELARKDDAKRYECCCECWWEIHAPPPREQRPISEIMALDEGLTIKVRRHREPREKRALVSGCELCGGMRPRGDRFCLKCRAVAMDVERITGEHVTAHLDPEKPDEWRAIRDGLKV